MYHIVKSRSCARILGIAVAAATTICVVLGHYGYLGAWFGAGETAVARATAPGVAEAGIKTLTDQVEGLGAKARHCRVESRILTGECEKLRSELVEKNDAIKALAHAAGENGLPPIKEGLALTDAEANTEIAFNGKVVKGSDVYRLLLDWSADCENGSKLLASKEATAKRLEHVAETIERKRAEILSEIGLLKNRLKELQASRDQAKAQKSLAELEAAVNGINAGRVGKAMETIEAEIRSLDAESAELSKDVLPKLAPKDVLQQKSNRYDDLAALWNDAD